MPEFYVEQRQSGVQLWIVEAASKAEAIRLARNGEGEAVDYNIDRWGAFSATVIGSSVPESECTEGAS